MENQNTTVQQTLDNSQSTSENTITPIPLENSQRITALRFILILLVITIHNNFQVGNCDYVFNQNAFGKWLQIFISDGLACASVPLFFMFAAYLQFKKPVPYKTLVLKKTKSLLIPLILWTLVTIGCACLIKVVTAKIAPSISDALGDLPYKEWGAYEWFHSFIGYSKGQSSRTLNGHVGQLWFIRDLFVLVLISPLLNLSAKKFPITTLLASFFMFICNIRPLIVDYQALFFFLLGRYWAVYDYPLFEKIDSIKWKAIIPVFILAVIYTYTIPNFASFRYLKFIDITLTKYHCSYWLMGCLACIILLKLSKLIVQNQKLYKISAYLATYSFFLFAIHSPLLLKALKILWVKVLPMNNFALCLAEYFGVTILDAAIGTGIGILLNKLIPPLFALLNGGRVSKKVAKNK